jgi:hypothetical protein
LKNSCQIILVLLGKLNTINHRMMSGPMAYPFRQHRSFFEFIFFSLFFGLFIAWFALLVVAIPIPTKFPNCVYGKVQAQHSLHGDLCVQDQQ